MTDVIDAMLPEAAASSDSVSDVDAAFDDYSYSGASNESDVFYPDVENYVPYNIVGPADGTAIHVTPGISDCYEFDDAYCNESSSGQLMFLPNACDGGVSYVSSTSTGGIPFPVDPLPPTVELLQTAWTAAVGPHAAVTWSTDGDVGMDVTASTKPGGGRHGNRNGSAAAAARRKRKSTPTQRVAANIRERRRMCSLNAAFDRLRRRVPAFPHEKKLSRIQTLRLAIKYIFFMSEVVMTTPLPSSCNGLQSQQTMTSNAAASILHTSLPAEVNNPTAASAVMWQPYDMAQAASGHVTYVEGYF